MNAHRIYILIACFVLFSYCIDGQEDSLLAQKALEAYSNQDYKLAISLYKRVLDIEPDNCVILNNIAATYFRLEMPDSALSIYKQMEPVCEDSVHQATVHFGLGKAYFLLGLRTKSYNEFKKFIAIDTVWGKSTVIHFFNTQYYDSRKEFPLDALEFSHSIDPNNRFINKELSKRYWKSKRILRAGYFYARSVLFKPDS